MQKTVALFGGSFNPPHEGHLAMASYVHKTLAVDETWMLFSENPEKDPKVYASLEHRMNMAEILAHHFDAPLVMSDLEDKIAKEKGRKETFFILEGLKERFPEYKFVFVMGADSFSRFHHWDERDDIMASTIIAVVGRPGYNDAALNSPTAQKFSDQIIDITDPENLRQASTGWCFMQNPLIDVSSSAIVEKLAQGSTDFDGPFADVVDYIYAHGLYNTHAHINSTAYAVQHLKME